MNKKWMALSLAGLLLLSGCGETGKDGGKVHMTVNGTEVTEDLFNGQLDLSKNLLAAQYGLAQSVENSLIQEKVMEQDLKNNDVEIADEEFKKDLDDMIAGYGGEEQYKEVLKNMEITEKQIEQSVRFQTILRKHKEWYKTNHAPDENSLMAAYEASKESFTTVEVSHILVKTQEEANDVLKRLDGGEDFATLAKELSQDKASAENGGSLGKVSPTQNNFVPEFSEAMNKLDEGQISDPVKSDFGFHIIRMDKINDSFEDVKEMVENMVVDQNHNLYIQDLVNKAEVTRPGEEKESSSSVQESSSASENN